MAYRAMTDPRMMPTSIATTLTPATNRIAGSAVRPLRLLTTLITAMTTAIKMATYQTSAYCFTAIDSPARTVMRVHKATTNRLAAIVVLL